MEYCPNSSVLAVGYNGGCLVINTLTLAETTLGSSDINDVDWNSLGSKLALCDEQKRVHVYDALAASWGAPVTSVDVGSPINACSFALDNSNDIIVGCDDGKTYKLTSASGYQTKTLQFTLGGQVNALGMRPGSGSVYIAGLQNDWATISSNLGSPYTPGCKVYVAEYDPTSSFFMYAGENGKVYMYNATGQNNTMVQTFANTGSNINAASYSGDGQYLVVGSDDRNVYLYSRNCVSCLFGYYLDYSLLECKFCGDAILGCGACSNSGSCQTCIQGFYLNPTGTACLPCDGVLTGCGACQGDSKCLFCMSGYYLDGLSCSPCGSTIPGCLICSDGSTCLQCHSDFYL